MTEDQIKLLFTRGDGSYLFARWGRPIAPIVFGVDDATLSVIKGAIEAISVLSGHPLAETDPELGTNFPMFFFREWDELLETPDLDRLVPELAQLVPKLKAADANQYRLFRFDNDGAIQAVFVFIRMDAALSEMPAEDLALVQVAQSMLLWSETAFKDRGALARIDDSVVLNPEIAAVIKAGYDPVMPRVATDASHALRLAARIDLLTGRDD